MKVIYMKNQMICSAIILLLSACNANPGAENATRQAANVAIVEKFRHAFEKKDFNTMDSLLADNYMGYGPSISDSINKAEAVASLKSETSDLYESLNYTFSESYPVAIKNGGGGGAGDWVSNWAYLAIKYKNGQGPVNVWVNANYKIENGKITRSRTFYNEADVLRQLGYGLSLTESK
jgi:limonene-1,2-epoxide hydrolase